MPNLLAHFAFQGVVARAVLPGADLRWVLLGTLLPDCAWILHRLLRASPLEIDPYDLRLYAVAQASLAVCLVLASALALLARSPRRAFAILSSGSLLHLLLDASETKWGNGVHLFAPFSWRIWNAGLYWPESLPIVALTLFGLGWVVWAWLYSPGDSVPLELRRGRLRFLATALLVFAYFILPVVLLEGAEEADAHFVKTLRDHEGRVGRRVEFDRVVYERTPSGGRLSTWDRETLRVAGGGPESSGLVSVRGRFADSGTLEIQEFHLHAGRTRDVASYAGLLVLAGVWLGWGRRQSRRGTPGDDPEWPPAKS